MNDYDKEEVANVVKREMAWRYPWINPYLYLNHYLDILIVNYVLVFLIIVCAVIAYIVNYNFPFEDPIENIKNTFSIAQVVSLIITLIIGFLASRFAKGAKQIIRNFIIVAILSICIGFCFIGIKSNLDNTYNSEKFGSYYDEYEKKTGEDKRVFQIGFSGVKIKDQRDYYIERSEGIYKIFTIKTKVFIVLQFFIAITLLFLILKIISNENKRARLEKDDKIVYDDEINCRY